MFFFLWYCRRQIAVRRCYEQSAWKILYKVSTRRTTQVIVHDKAPVQRFRNKSWGGKKRQDFKAQNLWGKGAYIRPAEPCRESIRFPLHRCLRKPWEPYCQYGEFPIYKIFVYAMWAVPWRNQEKQTRRKVGNMWTDMMCEPEKQLRHRDSRCMS